MPTSPIFRAGIALGSNLGDRQAHLRHALDLLATIAVPGEPVLKGAIYQTAPVGCPEGSPDFLNTVVEISHRGGPQALLRRTQAFQSQMGRREVAERNAPRPIDIDLLYYGGKRILTGALQLPHPRLGLRRFVLRPLADIRPELVLPGETLDISARLAAVRDGGGGLALACAEW